MSLHIEKGMKGDFWTDQLPEGLSLMRPVDKLMIVAAVVSLISSIVYVLYECIFNGGSAYDLIPWLAAPFFICGIIAYISLKYWILIVIACTGPIMWIFDVSSDMIFFSMFIVIGAAGVVGIICALQRMIFYRVIHMIEYVNIKKKLTLSDRLVAFLFNVPDDLDTRNITFNYSLRRTKIPWKEMGGSMSLGLMIGMFIWIYISMNPMFINLSTGSNIPLFMFALILYIPVLVMPWVIFKSLNVRIETNYRDFKVYNGIKATLKRMAVPVFAALMYVIVAINTSNIMSVLYYIVLSAIMIVSIIGFVSMLYYLVFESSIINDIVSKWKIFRPVSIFMGLDEKLSNGSLDDFPGTPIRDKNDFGKLIIPEEK